MTTAIRLSDYESSAALVAKMCPLRPSACACGECVAMCERSACIGTPEDIERLVEAGLESHLTACTWLVGVVFGVPPIRMVQIRPKRYQGLIRSEGAGCQFFAEGRCHLHSLGLKPSEGALATHQRSAPLEHPALVVALTWLLPCNESRVAGLLQRFSHPERRGVAA